MLKTVTFDLETVPDPEREAVIRPIVKEGLSDPERWRYKDENQQIAYQMAVTPEYCRIVSAAYAIDEESPRGAAVNQVGPDGITPLEETDLLRALWAHLEKATTVVTFNGGWFDLRVLKFRSALLGVESTRPDWVDIKPWDKGFTDCFRELYPNRKYTLSLKRAAQVFNLPVPDEFKEMLNEDGSQVADLWAAQELTALVSYNRMDVALTRELHRLFGGLYWPRVFRPHRNYDYQTGTWTEDR